ncbi:MAG TPA: hypothetical protein VHI52_12180, partial [Verrucomicrobiae bacterium]|nr:hypothetical protein [Verrucomicrobiae bacterium]
WTGTEVEGVVRASGRRLDTEESQWFGLKAHARHVPLTADLEMHSLPDGYVGISRLASDRVNVCGLFRRSGAHVRSRGPQVQLSPGASNARSLAWKTRLSGPPGTTLHARLQDAQFEEASLCSVAGLCLKPRLTGSRAECRIGDALTMTPPVTGNGMSMALEAAGLAIGPLAAYSRGELPWPAACGAVARGCHDAFASRLAWAQWLHWVMFTPLLRPFTGLLLSSGVLWRTLSAKTC